MSQGNESLSLIRSQIYLFRYISAAARRCSDSFAIAIVIIIGRSFVRSLIIIERADAAARGAVARKKTFAKAW